MIDFRFHQFERAMPFVNQVRQKPGWVTKMALAAAALVVVLPLLMLALAAVATFMVLFAVLGLVATVLRSVSGMPGRLRHPWQDDGRRNVRVVARDRF